MWNYRIIKHKTKRGVVWYGLHEVYYKKNGKIDLWSPKPSAMGDTVKDLVGSLAMQIRDATRWEVPVLNEREMPGYKRDQKHCNSCGQEVP